MTAQHEPIAATIHMPTDEQTLVWHEGDETGTLTVTSTELFSEENPRDLYINFFFDDAGDDHWIDEDHLMRLAPSFVDDALCHARHLVKIRGKLLEMKIVPVEDGQLLATARYSIWLEEKSTGEIVIDDPEEFDEIAEQIRENRY